MFFDKVVLEIAKGSLLEENHYYPHGLPIKTLSSTAQGVKDNRHKYQGNEYIKDLGLNWMDFHARQYDPQIGRFLAVDPLADDGGQQVFSPYAAMGNAPESMVDPNGTLAFDVSLGASKLPPHELDIAIAEYYKVGNFNTGSDWVLGQAMSFLAERQQKAFENSIANKFGATLGVGPLASIFGMYQCNFASGGGGGDSPNDEEPVKFLNNESALLNDVFSSIPYNKGDNIFYVMGHGNDDIIVDESGSKRIEIWTAKSFDRQMSEKNAAYKAAIEENKPFILWLYACSSANMAQKISKAHPNALVLGSNGIVYWGYTEDGHPAMKGIKTWKLDFFKTGTYIAYKNGEEIYRFPVLKTILFPDKK